MLQQIQETMRQEDMFETKQCRTCGVELTEQNWNPSWKEIGRLQCKDCNNPNRKIHNPKNNPLSMYVNGKYVSRKHPLYKPGRYKTFEDAAFSSLAKYETSVEGQVYVITNPNFPDWVKVGMAIDAEDRLNSYQTSSPFRDYVLQYRYDVNDRRKAESQAHTELQKSYERKGEWFKCTPEEARVVVSSTAEEYK